MSTTPDPTTLAMRFHQGDQTALVELYRMFSGPLFVTALTVLGDRDLAADAVQRAFLQAWQAAGSFDPSRPLKPWLYAITRRAAIDVHRRQGRTAGQVSLHSSDELLNRLPVDGPSMDELWQAWQVREALDKLHPDERRVVQLAYYDGYTQSEIAKVLNVALGTVKSRTARAQRRLAELLIHLRDVPEDSLQAAGRLPAECLS